jgi:hypothetical protein
VTYYGNGGGTADTKNNVETIRLETPSAGLYTIVVEAQRVVATFGSQPYALVGTAGQSFGGNTSSIFVGSQVFLPVVTRNAGQ